MKRIGAWWEKRVLVCVLVRLWRYLSKADFCGSQDYLGYHTNNNNIECFKWAKRNWFTCDIFPIGYHLNRCNKSIEHVIS